MQEPIKSPATVKETRSFGTLRRFRVLLVVVLVILSVQAWFGDFVNIFVAPASGVTPPPYSISGFMQAVSSYGFFLVWHAFEGIALFALAIAAFALSFVWSKSKGVRIATGLALFAVFAAALGGLLFVFSGFSAGGNSMQMGGSFVASYALYFVALYYSK